MIDKYNENNQLLQQSQSESDVENADFEPRKILASSSVANNLQPVLAIDKIQNEELPIAFVAFEALSLHYSKLIDFTSSGHLTLTPKGTIAEINIVGAKLLGVERKDLIHQDFTKFIADEYKDHWHRFNLLVKQQGGIHVCELLMLCKDGVSFYANIECQYREENYAPKELGVKFTDIVAKKQVEEKLRIAVRDFESQQAIIVTDLDNRILQTNQAFTRITGYSNQDLIGKSPDVLRSELHSNNFYQIRWAKVLRDNYWQGEIWYKRKNGEVFRSWETVTAGANANGKIIFYVISFTDISLINQAENALLDVYQRLDNQLATTNEELENLKKENAALSEALNFMVKRQEMQKSEVNIALLNQAELTVLPCLNKLKQSLVNQSQRTLLDILENNLINILQGNGSMIDFCASHQRLTHIESLVATMVRKGQPTKTIARNLSISPETVKIHRKHIRKKFGLVNKAQSLYSYLISLTG